MLHCRIRSSNKCGIWASNKQQVRRSPLAYFNFSENDVILVVLCQIGHVRTPKTEAQPFLGSSMFYWFLPRITSFPVVMPFCCWAQIKSNRWLEVISGKKFFFCSMDDWKNDLRPPNRHHAAGHDGTHPARPYIYADPRFAPEHSTSSSSGSVTGVLRSRRSRDGDAERATDHPAATLSSNRRRSESSNSCESGSSSGSSGTVITQWQVFWILHSSRIYFSSWRYVAVEWSTVQSDSEGWVIPTGIVQRFHIRIRKF